MITAVFTRFIKGENWCNGVVSDETGVVYDFEAKSFDNPSIFGIEKGRVSKLALKLRSSKGSGNWFTGVEVNYDRGWDIEPNENVKPYFDAVMELLENAPKRF